MSSASPAEMLILVDIACELTYQKVLQNLRSDVLDGRSGHGPPAWPPRGPGDLEEAGDLGSRGLGRWRRDGFARAVSSPRNLANLGSDLRSTSDALQEAAVPPNQRSAEVTLRRRWKL